MPNGYGREPAPKPYELVELALGEQIERGRPAGHERYDGGRHSGRLTLRVEALTPVHVGSGLIEPTGNPRQPLVRTLLRVGETPVIPGSSFKGCVRSVVEAITRSCVRVTRTRNLPHYLRGCQNKNKLCFACRLFGAPDYQGPLRFSDLALEGEREEHAEQVSTAEVPQFYRPRTREAIYYEEHRGQRTVRGRKFYQHGSQQAYGDTPIEVCRTGSVFEGQIEFINLSAAQIALLLVALGQSPEHPFHLKLGGAKPACYGSVKVEVARLEVVEAAAHYGAWEEPEPQTVNVPSFLTTVEPTLFQERLLLREPLSQLVETLAWPNERTCPSGNY